MAGGDGGSDPGPATTLVDAGKFICVGLPFPMGCTNPRQANLVGNFPAMWAYHRTMLAELERLVPNISQRLRVVVGFSNGAHTIAGYMALPEPNLLPGFTTYILAEGGDQGDYRHLAGRHVCVAWGEVGRTNKTGSLQLAAAAEAAQMKVVRVPQPGVGHAFDNVGKTAARQWLQGTVIASLVAETVAMLEKGDPGGYAAAKQLEVLAEGTEVEATFKEALAAAEAEAAEEFRELEDRIAGLPAKGAQTAAAESLRAFLRTYAGSEPAKAAQVMIDKIAQQELEALLESLPADPKPPKRRAAAVKLRKFAAIWPGSFAAATVRQTLDTYSDQAWEELRLSPPERPTPQQITALVAKCRKFLAEWPGTTGQRAALEVLGTLGRAELEQP